MSIITKIKAFFNFKGEKVEMELSKAEVKYGKIFLHPIDKPSETFVVKTKSVDLIINPEDEITSEDISIMHNENHEGQKEKKPSKKQEERQTNDVPENTGSGELINQFTKKRKFVVSLYPDEYEALVENINSNGYRRAEYLLACVNSAKKTSFDAMYRKYTVEHKERYKLEKSAGKNE